MITLESTGSKRGYHSALSWLGCAKKAAHKSEAEYQGLPPDELLIGSVGHELLRRWRLGDPISGDETWVYGTNQIPFSVINEARRVYQAYTSRYLSRDFGEVVATEMKFPFNEDHRQKIIEVLGSDRTGSADLVVNMTEEDIHRVQEESDIVLRGPGTYLIDDKFLSAAGESTLEKYRIDLQFTNYQVMLSLTGQYQVKGLIANLLIKTKTPKFHRVFNPPPDEDSILALRHLYQLADKREAEGPIADPTRCFDFFRICSLLSNGLCGRY